MAETGKVVNVNVTLQAMAAVGTEHAQETCAKQQTSKCSLLEATEEIANPFAAKYAAKWQNLKTRSPYVNKARSAKEKGRRLLPIEHIKENAKQFERDSRGELKAKTLEQIALNIDEEDSAEEILAKVLKLYEDVSLADKALEFLEKVVDGDLAHAVKGAREALNKTHGREITAGHNIAEKARTASSQGLGTTTTLRDMYRDITGNPRDSTTLFEELSQKYSFKELKQVIDFLLHSLGADLKSKGPSIPRALLHTLLTEVRSLQAILGVYRFFRGRMNLMHGLFQRSGLNFPSQLNFELMAKQFMNVASDRYPTAQKVLRMAVGLGIDKWIRAKIIVFSQLRDAVREVAMYQIYKSVQHRDEVHMAVIEALEELEDELEELEEREGEQSGEEEEDDI